MSIPTTLDARFRFPEDHRFTPDRIATEYRMLIRGYLDQMNYLFGTDPKAQEIRDCATRIYELTAGLSAHELQKHFRPPQAGSQAPSPAPAIAALEQAAQASARAEHVSRETPPDTPVATTEEGPAQ